jgi:DNA-binding IclR family transcriptional regulator
MVSAAGRRGPSEAREDLSLQVVQRTIEMLFRLVRDDAAHSVRALAEELHCSKSAAHRLLVTLEQLGVAEWDSDGHTYRAGPRLRDLGSDVWARMDLRAVRPTMEALRSRTGETVALHLYEDDGHVLVDFVESQQDVRYVPPLGQHVQWMRGGATSKVFMAWLPAAELEVIRAEALGARQRRVSDAELADVRRNGYAFSTQEHAHGAASLSAGILDRRGRPRWALSIKAPVFRFSETQAVSYAPDLLQATRQISRAIGNAPADSAAALLSPTTSATKRAISPASQHKIGRIT